MYICKCKKKYRAIKFTWKHTFSLFQAELKASLLHHREISITSHAYASCRLDIINQRTVSSGSKISTNGQYARTMAQGYTLHQDFTTLRCKIVMQEEGEIPRGGEKVIVHNTCVTPKSCVTPSLDFTITALSSADKQTCRLQRIASSIDFLPP